MAQKRKEQVKQLVSKRKSTKTNESKVFVEKIAPAKGSQKAPRKAKESARKDVVKKGTVKTKATRRKAILEKFRARRLRINQSRGLIYISHLPHGFYENEIRAYFKQFGAVTNVKVSRSARTTKSKGYGFVEFYHPDVAKIAAETMNNYLMFKKRIECRFIPSEERPKFLFAKRPVAPEKAAFSFERRRQRCIVTKNRAASDNVHLKRCKSKLKLLQKKLERINGFCDGYDFKAVDIPVALHNYSDTVVPNVEEKVEDD